MSRPSLQTQLLRELPILLLSAMNDATDDLIMPAGQVPPPLGKILFPDTPSIAQLYDLLFDEEKELWDLLTAVTASRSLESRYITAFGLFDSGEVDGAQLAEDPDKSDESAEAAKLQDGSESSEGMI